MLSLVPGVSRSGSTIVGAMLLGTDKRSAAEFSFFVAIPLMIGAFGLDGWKNRALIGNELGLSIAIGFAFAFIAAFFVVRFALDYISRHGFAPFAYWRIFVGAIGLWGVLLFK
jgi:undecaprenyl-diphosphatase